MSKEKFEILGDFIAGVYEDSDDLYFIGTTQDKGTYNATDLFNVVRESLNRKGFIPAKDQIHIQRILKGSLFTLIGDVNDEYIGQLKRLLERGNNLILLPPYTQISVKL